jgi:uncharacterized protein with FMN-binding domain
MRRVAFAIVSTIAGLVGLLSFKTESLGSAAASSSLSITHTGTTTSGSTAAAPNGSTSTSGSTSSTKTGTSASTGKTSTTTKQKTATSASPSNAAAPATKTVTGTVVQTQYGPVQVKITVTSGKVSAATAVQYPNGDPRSQQINAYALPILQRETVGISSAGSVDMVSGATYTSNGYLQSLQSALDQAGL